jgi:hypothetical protein
MLYWFLWVVCRLTLSGTYEIFSLSIPRFLCYQEDSLFLFIMLIFLVYTPSLCFFLLGVCHLLPPTVITISSFFGSGVHQHITVVPRPPMRVLVSTVNSCSTFQSWGWWWLNLQIFWEQTSTTYDHDDWKGRTLTACHQLSHRPTTFTFHLMFRTSGESKGVIG